MARQFMKAAIVTIKSHRRDDQERPVQRRVRRLVEVRLETVCQAIGRLLADSNPEQVRP